MERRSSDFVFIVSYTLDESDITTVFMEKYLT